MQSARRITATAFVLAAALAACAPSYGDAYLAAFARGERAYHAGRFDEAAAAFDEAAVKAARIKDRDEARFLVARSFERTQRWADAREAYNRLIEGSPRGPRTARAAFEVAEIEIAHGDAERGYRMLEEAARRYPNHGLARPAIRRIVDHLRETEGDENVLAFLRSRRAVFHGTEEAQMIAYEEARALERVGRKQEAHDAFIATARAHPYPHGPLTDDAFFRAAELSVELGRPQEAVAHLRELLSSREISRGLFGRYDMASYERPRYPEAQLRIAEIFRDAIKDRRAARLEFEKMYRNHPKARRRDYALWSEATLARADGDTKAACELTARIEHEFPASRYTPCARLLCPSAPAGKRECADYIVRGLFSSSDRSPSTGK